MGEYRLLIDNKQILLVTIYKADFLESFLFISVSDPYHFDADPDPDLPIRIHDDESGS